MPNETTHISVFFALVICLLICSCDAPRKNPLDPQNPDTKIVTLEGVVQTFEDPRSPISGATVHWKRGDLIKETPATGQFAFNGIPPRDGWLICQKPGRKTDSVYIEWNGAKALTRTFTLRMAPSLSGRVTRAGQSDSPIANATVFWQNESKYTTTDSLGYYSFQDLNREDGLLVFQKENYAADSVWISWENSDHLTQNMSLNTMPILQGKVQTSRVPPMPIVGAKVTWNPGNQYTFTDASGNFTFNNPVIEDGVLIIVAEGYKPDSTTISWQNQQLVTKNFFLNAKPQLDELAIYSTVEFDYGDRTTFKMIVESKISDQEGDIDSVYIKNDDLNIKASLNYDVLKRQFERTFSALDLGLNSIREAVGYDFEIIVVDQYNDTFILGTDRIERLILDEIPILNPINNELVQENFSVEWDFFNPEFSFTFTVEVYTNQDFTSDLVWRKTKIPADTSNVVVTKSLPAGEYFWWIWCVDQFNNKSRSKPGSFEIGL